jgi:L-alanine-DL-glutamate epimerase-like enolase superfamily enzyme
MITIKAFHQSLPLAQVFRISRGAKTSAEVIVVVISDGQFHGWGEAVPYARYGESVESVSLQLWKIAGQDLQIEDHHRLNEILPAGSARNALDCAFWDLLAKRSGKSVNQMIRTPTMASCVTAQTISIDSIENMQSAALELAHAPLIKVKLDADDILQKMQVIHQQCPNSRFIIDANEAWHIGILSRVVEPLSKMNVVLIEQPLAAEFDDELRGFNSPIPLCADESCHSMQGLSALKDRYNAINVKLDKTGGLSDALNLIKHARSLDFEVMIGCMVGSSLAMAPAFALAGLADYIDLDGPLLVAKDRQSRFSFENGTMFPPHEGLWGQAISSNKDSDLQALLN